MCGIYHLTVEVLLLLSVTMGQRTGDVYVLVTDSVIQAIWKMDVSNLNYSLVKIDSHEHPIAIDYDPVQNQIYWTDVKRADIRRCGFDGEDITLVYKLNSKAMPDGMALDPISRLIFYTDTGNDVIAMIDMTDVYRKTIISENLDEPRGIALDRERGMMYWTDWGEQPKIERATYLGENRTTLVSTDMTWPNGITLDTQAQKIYWCDGSNHVIHGVDYDGSNRIGIAKTETFRPFDIFLFEDVLYGTDWHTGGIFHVYLENRNISVWTASLFFRLNGIHVFRAGDFQNDTNACTNNKGGCEHLCIPTSGGRQCACADGMTLDTDGFSCLGDDGLKVKCNGSCNVHFDNSHIVYENGSVQTESGGVCSPHGQCTNCNKGFYPTAGYCDMCNSIDNCDLEECSSGSDAACTRCEGVVVETVGLRAYVPSSDRRHCRQACSWRGDSTRCYPGLCFNELSSNCECHTGFTGHHCQTIVTKPSMQVFVTLTDKDGKQFDIESRDMMTLQASFWTNVGNPISLFYHLVAQYTVPLPHTLPAKPAYITQFDVGVIQGTFRLKLIRGTDTLVNVNLSCKDVNATNPKAYLNNCHQLIAASDFPSTALPLQNKDKIDLVFESSNGGYVEVRNKETGDSDTFTYDGQTERKLYTINIDLIKPYHCSVTSVCPFSMVYVDDIIKRAHDSRIHINLEGWKDDESGATTLNVKIIQLRYSSGQLHSRSGNQVFETTVNLIHDQTVAFKLKTLGVYSIILSASDKAKNERKARRIVMYDPSSTITVNKDQAIRITSAVASTNYTWQWDTSVVRIDFTDRFINRLQTTNHWLASVANDTEIEKQFDDYQGQRTVSEIPNKQGIVRFKTAYLINPKGQQLTSLPPDVQFEDQGLDTVVDLRHQLADGDVVSAWVKAYDVKDNVKAERVQVHVDSSLPEITEVIVEEDSNNGIIIHLRTADRHSGIGKISWKITDEATNISFGFQEKRFLPLSVTSCSHLTTLSEAQACYCTPSFACFTTDFTVNVTQIQGVKDSYSIAVTVWNNAQKSVTTHIQGPTSDITKDEVTGEELSFEWGSVFQSLQGIQFYKYTVGPRCYSIDEVESDSLHIKVTKTTESAVTWTAPSAGNHYITLVVFNSAAHPIYAKCSEVTIVEQFTDNQPNQTVSTRISANQSAVSEDKIISLDPTTIRIPAASREKNPAVPIYIPIAVVVAVVLLVVIIVVVVLIKRRRKKTESEEYKHLYINHTDQSTDRETVFNTAYAMGDDGVTNNLDTQQNAGKEEGEGRCAQLDACGLHTSQNEYVEISPKEDKSRANSDYSHPTCFLNEN